MNLPSERSLQNIQSKNQIVNVTKFESAVTGLNISEYTTKILNVCVDGSRSSVMCVGKLSWAIFFIEVLKLDAYHGSRTQVCVSDYLNYEFSW